MALGNMYFTVDFDISRKDKYIVVDDDDGIVEECSGEDAAKREAKEHCKEFEETHRVYKLVGAAKPRRKAVDVDYEEID